MLLFCPACGNVLVAEEGARCHRFACTTCPYVRNVTRKVSSRKYPKLKEVDDVLGGAAAWENVDSTAAMLQVQRSPVSRSSERRAVSTQLCLQIDFMSKEQKKPNQWIKRPSESCEIV
ncbi:DNA-directed RNA polymerase III subunit RPC10 isoform X1 [Gopherus evgoodei]|uniref:DNA-directed RNA polymerase III subunit RPC10 isoform X1 n=1 Tax=Gopherus evgoodei TaxID=1825980 RepID=UPI0011D0353D|nr:DNA-directed RNA polymerase III subunit RPC10 isoform X1 [Gopherus evgoodei]XP_030435088.1 DNA-directed RNA polymerase III subunit RPC10 isoform X1 [Gopherus evgoodei]XP_030435090.1 DNA-directed RNA polymerase III subunit RPC10 isoform X1 [Gopherus evgoodei]